jgi:hypothetical protein
LGINQSIIDASNQKKAKTFYFFPSRDKISLDVDWQAYFKQHIYILRGFIYWELVKYLQKNNPNVIGLSEKLFKPTERYLKLAHNFWKTYVDLTGSVTCIYSGQALVTGLSIDHFVPWSYIAHDQLWNLLPTTKSINSSKNDALPDTQKYLDSFANLQYEAFNTIFQSHLTKKADLLDDYVNLFALDLNNIAQIPVITFKDKIKSTIEPMTQIAKNMGFIANWTYK